MFNNKTEELGENLADYEVSMTWQSMKSKTKKSPVSK
jgi:hypothetical protein